MNVSKEGQLKSLGECDLGLSLIGFPRTQSNCDRNKYLAADDEKWFWLSDRTDNFTKKGSIEQNDVKVRCFVSATFFWL